MTLLQLRTLARKRLGDAGGAFWTDAEINTYINDGCRDVAYRTKSIKTNGYITPISCSASTSATTGGTREWTLSTTLTGIYSIEDVYYFQNNVWTKMVPTSRDDLNNESDGWLSNVGYTVTSGTTTYNYASNASIPTHYYWDREEDIFGIDPPPSSGNVGTDYIRVYYTKKYTDISSDSSTPGIPEPLHQCVVNFAAATGFEDRGWGERANDQWAKYFKRISDYLVETNREREDDEIIMKSYKNV